MNFVLFELAGELLAALKLAEASLTASGTRGGLDDVIAAIAKAEAAGIVARPTEQA